jgi:hypothetical protein
MYNNVVTSVRTSYWVTDDFLIRITLHQGSVLNPYCFVLVIDMDIRDMQGISLGVCFFADGVVLVDES